MEELLKQYEQIINRLFNAELWLENKGVDNWEAIKGKKAYIEYNKLLKEAEQLQEALHKHFKIKNY
jgi:exonuclease VII small subunit